MRRTLVALLGGVVIAALNTAGSVAVVGAVSPDPDQYLIVKIIAPAKATLSTDGTTCNGTARVRITAIGGHGVHQIKAKMYLIEHFIPYQSTEWQRSPRYDPAPSSHVIRLPYKGSLNFPTGGAYNFYVQAIGDRDKPALDINKKVLLASDFGCPIDEVAEHMRVGDNSTINGSKSADSNQSSGGGGGGNSKGSKKAKTTDATTPPTNGAVNYAGMTLTAHVPNPAGSTSTLPGPPLAVECSRTECALVVNGTRIPSQSNAFRFSTAWTIPRPAPCSSQMTLTYALQSTGRTVRDGLSYPARLTGTITVDLPGSVTAGNGVDSTLETVCQGATDTWTVDATPIG